MPYTLPGSVNTATSCKEFQIIGNLKQTVESLMEKNLGLWIVDIAESLGQSSPTHQPGEWAVLKMESTMLRQAALADAESTNKPPLLIPVWIAAAWAKQVFLILLNHDSAISLLSSMSSWTMTLFICVLALCIRFFISLIFKVCFLLWHILHSGVVTSELPPQDNEIFSFSLLCEAFADTPNPPDQFAYLLWVQE